MALITQGMRFFSLLSNNPYKKPFPFVSYMKYFIIRSKLSVFLIISNTSTYYNYNKANFSTALITIVLHKHATMLKQETQQGRTVRILILFADQRTRHRRSIINKTNGHVHVGVHRNTCIAYFWFVYYCYFTFYVVSTLVKLVGDYCYFYTF